MLLRFFFLIIACLAAAGGARADDYIKPSWPDLARTMVRFNALDLSDLAVLDEYAIVTECDLYAAFYGDDFKWHQVQQAVLKSVKANIATYPTNYFYDTQLQLDRYDFNARLFRFTGKTAIHNVNSFTFFSVAGTGCGNAVVKIIPRGFRAVVTDPINMDGIPLAEKDAQTLLAQMTKDGNSNRLIYARFNLRITYIDPVRKTISSKEAGGPARYAQEKVAPENGLRVDTSPSAVHDNILRLDARLGSIDFYEDPQKQVLIYELQL